MAADRIEELEAALAASTAALELYRIESDEAMRDYEVLELVVSTALAYLNKALVREARAILDVALNGAGPGAALSSKQVSLRCIICRAEVPTTETTEHLGTHSKEELAERLRDNATWWAELDDPRFVPRADTEKP